MSDYLRRMFEGLGDNSISKRVKRVMESQDNLVVGDRVTFKMPESIFFLVDMETMKQVFPEPKSLNEGLKIYFLTGDGILGDILPKPIVYKCDHCEAEHRVDAIIYFPSIGKRYYTQLIDLCLQETSPYEVHKVTSKEEFESILRKVQEDINRG